MDNSKLLSLYQLKQQKKLLSNYNKYQYSKTTNDLLNPEKQNHFKYHKLYNISNSNENSKQEKTKEKLRIKLKDKKKFEMLKKVFQKPEKKPFTLIKLTKAKLPFSSKNNIDPKEKRKKIKSLRPNRKYHNSYMIKWLKNKYSNSVLEKSINTLLPDNGRPVIPDDESKSDKKHRKLMEFLESLKPVIEKEKNVNINPKYFYNKKTFEKILKLKEIFLEFDEDGSRKMELDEMFTMFNQNNIFADLNELVNLFFKNKKIKQKDIMKLYLDFFQFIEFSLHRDQEFRYFMRQIKEKYNTEEYKESNSLEGSDEKTYLPMSFNLILDYFISKGKERGAVDNIKKTIKDIDEILYKGLENDKNLLDLNLNIFSKSNRRQSVDVRQKRVYNRLASIRINDKKTTLNKERNLKEEEEDRKFLKKLEKINFKKPIKEFEKLINTFGVKFTKKSEKSNLTRNTYEKKISKLYQSTHNSILSDNSTSYGKQTGMTSNTKKILYINEDSISGNISKNIENSEDNSVIKDIVNNYFNKKLIKTKNKQNYDKFNNIQINIDNSSKENNSLETIIKNKNRDSNNINTYSKEYINNFDKTFFKSRKLENNQFNDILSGKKLNPFSQYTSYFRKKNKINKYGSNNKNKNFMINGCFMKNDKNETEINTTYNSFAIRNNSKNKTNTFNSREKSINKDKYDYIPLDLLK